MADQKRPNGQKDEFMNFLYYCIYLLKLCSKNQMKAQLPEEGDSKPVKKYNKAKRPVESSQTSSKGFKEIQKMFNSQFST